MKLRVVPVFMAAFALTLTGCTIADANFTQQAKEAGCEIPASGSQSDSIKVTGEFGEQPTVEFSTPLKVDGVQRTILIEGDGDIIVEGDTVKSRLTLVNGVDGEQIASEELDLPVDSSVLPTPGWLAIADCMPVGSRAVTTMSGADLYGETGNETLGITAEDSVVIVVDAQRTVFNCTGELPDNFLDRAEGESASLPDGFPTLTLADNGDPTLTFPEGFVPVNELRIANSINGEGEEVQEGDCVVVHYKGMNQETGEIFDESWARGNPAQFTTDGVIPGFRDALVGQNVGSQVVALINPDNGYGPAVEGDAKTGNIAFVVDILATNR
ncbi:FKBP-type peptidyl-prolyl cis-trans isomerase [Lysinibacter sp. HNR]|uniref:FKBP-type peptidyl-prolyl cis-trans isomerase n=1 Tax=Lysinibacter sp. HNR TaxID=3031408 RepID=UPI0024350922|nr:FKBP-type peptidyl-prolyl cis-trans isomerase [Lysinibacter sp. HNR]WGD37976.1 FKBP-type peptidyl-prolyl cis-trans isomerase [Lysinibacter sp. HNR]